MAATQLAVVVDGRWISQECHYGDVEMSTVWPGGSDEMTWSLSTLPAHRFRGGETVTGVFGGAPEFAGSLVEPDPSQDQMTAIGAWREADNFPALDGGGNASKIPNVAVDAAIAAGLRWSRPTSITSSAVDIDISQGPVKLSALLDAWSEQSGSRWAVDASRTLYAQPDDTIPAYQTDPLRGGLGFALDTYASTLVGRYWNGTTYATTTRTDAAAERDHGHVADIVDLTPRGTLTLAKANTILDNLLAFGRAIPQWTIPLNLSYGEILSRGGVPVALETVRAGKVLRIHGGFELAQRLNGAMYLDVLIGRTQLAAGVLTLSPMQLASRNLTDVLTAALTKK